MVLVPPNDIPQTIILLTLFCFTFLIVPSTSKSPREFWPIFWNCTNSAGNFNQSSPYNASLSKALSSLTSMSSAMPFSNVTENSGDTHVVYALFNCRNDLPLGTCRRCVEDAAENILDLCHPWPKEAIVIYKECMLRYANRMIFSSMELKPYKQHCGGVKYLVSTSEIKSGVKRKLEAMIDEATNSSDYFAIGHVNDIANHKVYFLVQCTPDLSKEQCNDCLTHSLNFTVQSCASDNRLWGHTMFPSCQMRYDIEPFFNVSSNDLTHEGSASKSSMSPLSTNNCEDIRLILFEKLSFSLFVMILEFLL